MAQAPSDGPPTPSSRGGQTPHVRGPGAEPSGGSRAGHIAPWDRSSCPLSRQAALGAPWQMCKQVTGAGFQRSSCLPTPTLSLGHVREVGSPAWVGEDGLGHTRSPGVRENDLPGEEKIHSLSLDLKQNDFFLCKHRLFSGAINAFKKES